MGALWAKIDQLFKASPKEGGMLGDFRRLAASYSKLKLTAEEVHSGPVDPFTEAGRRHYSDQLSVIDRFCGLLNAFIAKVQAKIDAANNDAAKQTTSQQAAWRKGVQDMVKVCRPFRSPDCRPDEVGHQLSELVAVSAAYPAGMVQGVIC
jgi:hypothetical protein